MVETSLSHLFGLDLVEAYTDGGFEIEHMLESIGKGIREAFAETPSEEVI